MKHAVTLIELLGVAAVVCGVSMWSVAAAFVVGGVAVIAICEQRT